MTFNVVYEPSNSLVVLFWDSINTVTLCIIIELSKKSKISWITYAKREKIVLQSVDVRKKRHIIITEGTTQIITMVRMQQRIRKPERVAETMTRRVKFRVCYAYAWQKNWSHRWYWRRVPKKIHRFGFLKKKALYDRQTPFKSQRKVFLIMLAIHVRPVYSK